MNIIFLVISFFILQGICLYVGKRAARKLDNAEDYFLAGRGISFFPLMMTFVATQIGGGLILGSAEEAYKYGWAVFLYPLGQSLGFLILAFGVGKRLLSFKVTTVAALFEVVYNSPRLKKLGSIFSIISLFLILIAQMIASKKFLCSLGVESAWIFVALWGIVIFYTMAGGLKAVIATDIIQALFFLVVFGISFLVAFFLAEVPTQVTETTPFVFETAKLTGWLLMPMLFTVIEQDMGQRCFGAKSKRSLFFATLFAAAATFVVALIPLFYGVWAKLHGIVIPPGSSVFMSTVAQVNGPWLGALVGCGIMAAILSTADSLLNAISSNITQDFKFKSNNVKHLQIVTLLLGSLALLLSFAFTEVVSLLILSYELSVSALFVPLFFALFVKRGEKNAAIFSIICGSVAFALTKIWGPFPLPGEIISLACSFAGYGIGLLLPTSQPKEVVQK